MPNECKIVQRIGEPHGNKNYGVRGGSCIPFFFLHVMSKVCLLT